MTDRLFFQHKIKKNTYILTNSLGDPRTELVTIFTWLCFIVVAKLKQPMVNCGAEKRDNCNNCPFELKHDNVDNKRDFKGETWCNGDCKWNTGNMLHLLTVHYNINRVQMWCLKKNKKIRGAWEVKWAVVGVVLFTINYVFNPCPFASQLQFHTKNRIKNQALKKNTIVPTKPKKNQDLVDSVAGGDLLPLSKI